MNVLKGVGAPGKPEVDDKPSAVDDRDKAMDACRRGLAWWLGWCGAGIGERVGISYRMVGVV